MISVSSLSVAFAGVRVVDDVSFEIAPGEVFAIVGQSGSGKSVTARSLIGLSGGSVTASRVDVDGVDVLTASRRRMRALRGPAVGYVSQGALVALDPLRLVGREVADPLRLHTSLSAAARQERVVSLLADVGIPDPELRARQRADELSGGLRQRAIIASAIALSPRFIVADEPTTALDSTVAAGILDLLERLRDEGAAILLISHDLATVSRLASRIAVMHEGRFVETGPTASVLGDPQHPYTRSLLAAVPTGAPRHARLSPMPTSPMPNEGPERSPSTSGAILRQEPLSAPSFGTETALEARGLRKTFGSRVAVDDAGFTLERGRTLGIVGESGSGKTTVARIALALERADAGTTDAHGHRISAIYQDALSSFDPRWRVGRILGPDAARLLALVGLDPTLASKRPALLSGGQQQRVGIARALARDPEIIICDEPVSSLDVSAQALVLDLLDDLQRRLGLSYLFISHDLGVIRHVSDDVLVMRDGRVLEHGPTEAVFANPQHDYTRALIASAPSLPR